MPNLADIKYGDLSVPKQSNADRLRAWPNSMLHKLAAYYRRSPIFHPSWWNTEEWRLAANIVQATAAVLVLAGAVYTFYYSPYARRNEERLQVEADLAKLNLRDALALTAKAKDDRDEAEAGAKAAAAREQQARIAEKLARERVEQFDAQINDLQSQKDTLEKVKRELEEQTRVQAERTEELREDAIAAQDRELEARSLAEEEAKKAQRLMQVSDALRAEIKAIGATRENYVKALRGRDIAVASSAIKQAMQVYCVALGAARDFVDAPRWMEREKSLSEWTLVQEMASPKQTVRRGAHTCENDQSEVSRYLGMKASMRRSYSFQPSKQLTLVQFAAEQMERTTILKPLAGRELLLELLQSARSLETKDFGLLLQEVSAVARDNPGLALDEPLLVRVEQIKGHWNDAQQEVERVHKALTDLSRFADLLQERFTLGVELDTSLVRFNRK